LEVEVVGLIRFVVLGVFVFGMFVGSIVWLVVCGGFCAIKKKIFL
jgi:hypothetical protein